MGDLNLQVPKKLFTVDWQLQSAVPKACCVRDATRLSSRYALVTMADNGYMLPLVAMLQSFADHNPWFDGDVIIPHSVAHEQYPPIIDLSEANQRILQALVGKRLHLIFKKVPDASYRTKLDMKKLGRYVRSAFHLEAFDIFGYKRIVYYDVDSVFTGSVKEVFEHRHPFVVTYDDWTSIFRPNPAPDKGSLAAPGSATYQGGFMSLGPAICNPTVNMKTHFLRLISQHQKWHMADQVSGLVIEVVLSIQCMADQVSGLPV
jgi:hypothetical protein